MNRLEKIIIPYLRRNFSIREIKKKEMYTNFLMIPYRITDDCNKIEQILSKNGYEYCYTKTDDLERKNGYRVSYQFTTWYNPFFKKPKLGDMIDKN